MTDKVRVQRIYDEIIEENGWSEYKESMARLLRKKFQFLLKNVMARNVSLLKNGGKIEVLMRESSIIKNILIESIDDESIVSDWFNEKLDLSESENVVLLYSVIKEPIMRPFMQGLTDEVTMDTWLSAVDASIDYSNAQRTLNMKQLLEELRNMSMPLNHCIPSGDLILEDEFGNRNYISRGCPSDITIDEQIIKQLLNGIATHSDYIETLNLLLSKFIKHAREASINDIATYALTKEMMDEGSTARDLCCDEGEVASEYVMRFRNIRKFLQGVVSRNPQKFRKWLILPKALKLNC